MKQRCSPPTCSHSDGRSALPLLVHEVVVLVIAKTGVDFSPRKRPTLRFLASLGPLQGILQPPAGLLVRARAAPTRPSARPAGEPRPWCPGPPAHRTKICRRDGP